ncbi:MAG TPA: dihydrofolate reductase [Bacteroidetes bacterium]|nr:dihydrofolate reductase [Bacteroidota bacterium]
MNLIIIAALTKNRVIGKNGAVPWDIPSDVERFKQLTLDHVVLMGRRTYETLSTPLVNRRNVVITSRRLEGVETYATIADALRALEREGDVYVIGGGQIFAELLDSAASLRLTIVDQEIDGDTFFPPYEHLIGTVFRLVSEEEGEGFTFKDYVRI